LQQLRPGVAIGEIAIAAKEAIKATGYQLLGHVGHNVGLQVEEHPFLESSTAAGPDSKIKRNMVVAFFQGSIQAKQNLGIRLEDTAVITESGARMLTSETKPRYQAGGHRSHNRIRSKNANYLSQEPIFPVIEFFTSSPHVQ